MLLSFFKQRASIISKLVVHQLGLMVFGIAVTTGVLSFALEESEATQNLYIALASAFSVLFYLVLLVIAANDEGARDKIRIDGGRLKRDAFMGGKLGLAANSLNLLLGVVLCVLYFINNPVADTVYSICLIIAVVIQSPYMGLRTVFMPYNPVAFLIMPVLPVLATFFGYYLGIRGVLLVKEKKRK